VEKRFEPEPPKVYVETSVWGMTLASQPRALREPTKKFLTQCRLGLFLPHISNVVFQELKRANPRDADRILAEVGKLAPVELMSSPESEHLAEEYIKAGIVPAKKGDDARHVAIATLTGMEMLVSWNHRHLANARKKDLFNAVNRLAGRDNELLIYTPFEVLR
jgi:hypothetical protein